MNFFSQDNKYFHGIGRTLLLFVLSVSVFAIPAAAAPLSLSADEKTLFVEDSHDAEVIAFGKTVVVKERAKGVFTLGGDIVVEGRVDGDVGTIGGSVIQKKDAYIGGDVIVIGGSYKPEAEVPLRDPGKETVMFGVFEEEIRNLTREPATIFAPGFSVAFLAQRALSVLFWFLVSLAVATIAPGAVGRAAARVQLSTLKIAAFGFFSFVVLSIAVIASITFLPNYLSGVFGLMSFFVLMLAYVFGRVTLHVSTGKFIQRHLIPERLHSDALAIFLGVAAWTILLSLPYLWPLALLALFGAGIGLVLTAFPNGETRTGHI